MKEQKKRARFYVGSNHGNKIREVFRSNVIPTEENQPRFKAVIGPFRTHVAATWFAMHPFCQMQTVQEIEKHVKNRLGAQHVNGTK